MKKTGLFAMVLLIAACSPKTDEAIKQKIIQKKTKIGKIKQQIAELEAQLGKDSASI